MLLGLLWWSLHTIKPLVASFIGIKPMHGSTTHEPLFLVKPTALCIGICRVSSYSIGFFLHRRGRQLNACTSGRFAFWNVQFSFFGCCFASSKYYLTEKNEKWKFSVGVLYAWLMAKEWAIPEISDHGKRGPYFGNMPPWP